MPRVVPSQVRGFVDNAFSWAATQEPGPDVGALDGGAAASLAGLVDLINQIPSELIRLEGPAYTEFVASLAAIRTALATWQVRGANWPLNPVPGLPQVSPVTLIRRALAKCPDAVAAPGTTELPFIRDEAFRESLRLDMSDMNRALVDGAWKAATVLAGSVVEALLLWALLERDRRDLGTIAASARRVRPASVAERPPEEWNLPDYIEVSGPKALGIIRADTVAQTWLAKDYRNLIHAGRAFRLGQRCDRGTALSAVAAVELVVRDLGS